jgi:hypothetical protein
VAISHWYNRFLRSEREPQSGSRSAKSPSDAASRFFGVAGTTGVLLLLVYASGNPFVYSQLGPKVQEVVGTLRTAELNRRDATLLQRSYYENLVGVSRFNSQLWEVYMQRPPDDWPALQETREINQFRGDFLRHELRPSLAILFHGAPLHTNRWGMRDREYEQRKPPETYRIALLGTSIQMGWGVADEETFESLLEERLNRETDGRRHSRYEILNFALSRYTWPQYLMLLETKVLSFEPDAVFFFAHEGDAEVAAYHLAERIRSGSSIPYRYLRDIGDRARLARKTDESAAERQLAPYRREMLVSTYRRVVDLCRERGVLPVWIYLSRPGKDVARESIDNVLRLAQEAGFIVLDLSDAYQGHDPSALQVASWDIHPNARGHQVIADRLYRALREEEQAATLGMFSGAEDKLTVGR